MLDLSRDLEHEAARFVSSLRREQRTYTNSANVDDYGQAHPKGGLFAAKGKGVYASTHGFTRADVAAFRRTLEERLGFAPPVPMAEALLIQTHNSPEAIVTKEQDQKRKRERDKKAKRRKWARAHGYCIICCKNAGTYTATGEQLATCEDCRNRVVENRKGKK